MAKGSNRVDPSHAVGQDARTFMVSRLALAGALAGSVAALLDHALALPGAATFLPTGSWRLLAFLVGLYGLSGLVVGVVLGALLAALELGDVGAALGVHARPGARVVAYGALTVTLLVGVGALLRPIAESYFVFFHNHMLIAAVTGATAAGLLLLALCLVALMAGPLSAVLPFGPRVDPRPTAPLVVLPALVVAAYAGAGFVALDVAYLFSRPRMTPVARALNAALAAPACLLAGLLVGALLYRVLHRVHEEATAPRVFVATLLTLVVPVLAGAAVQWPVVKQLDGAPFLTGAVLLLVLVVAGTFLRGRAWHAVVTLCVLGTLTLVLGKVPRVRKAASLTALAPPLVRTIQLGFDLDRDGYSALLGGGDCNDLDASVHPGAFDWPDDGIDQDCNGHEATLSTQATKAYAPVPDAVPRQPNVLLLTLDALRADHVSAYGYARKTTPRLDELAQSGIRFDSAWSHAPSTRYSVPAILTGRYPSTVAVNPDPRVHWPPLVLPENRLLAEMMHDLGYRTGATLTYHYFERGWGLDQGFDDYDYHLFTLHSAGGDPAATSGTSSKQLADLDIAWLDAHKDAPFFLWSHFYDTHFRFERHPDLPETDFGTDEQALYDGEIRYADFHIGRVLDELRALGLWDRTIVIVTSDHGDGFGEHGIPQSKRHGYHLYRTETKVPVLMHVPGLQPRVVMTPIGHVDLIPTLMNVLRRAPSDEPQLLGESLLAAMLGDDKNAESRAIYQEVWYEGPTSKQAIVTRGAHLVRNLVPEDTTELYDLGKDLPEEHDLAGLGLPLEDTLRARLGAVIDEIAIPRDFATRLRDARVPRVPSQPLGDALGEYAHVVGVDVEHPNVHPNDTSVVTVHLQIDSAIPDGWLLFTHVTGPGGRILNLDHVPLENLAPLQQQKAGTYLRDPIAVAFPADWPPGPARVELGLYRRGQRAHAVGAHSVADAVNVATLQVAR